MEFTHDVASQKKVGLIFKFSDVRTSAVTNWIFPKEFCVDSVSLQIYVCAFTSCWLCDNRWENPTRYVQQLHLSLEQLLNVLPPGRRCGCMASFATYGRHWTTDVATSLHDETWLPIQMELKRAPALFLIINKICKLSTHRHLWAAVYDLDMLFMFMLGTMESYSWAVWWKSGLMQCFPQTRISAKMLLYQNIFRAQNRELLLNQQRLYCGLFFRSSSSSVPLSLFSSSFVILTIINRPCIFLFLYFSSYLFFEVSFSSPPCYYYSTTLPFLPPLSYNHYADLSKTILRMD